MSDEPSLSVDRVLNSLPGRILLVILAAAAVAVITPQIFRVNQVVPFLILRWSVVALVGVVSGLVARYILGARTAALRLWTALLAALVGLILLGLTTEGTAGAILPERSQAELNWTWLVQFAFSALLAWLTLSAYPPALPEKSTRRKRKSPASKTARARKSPAKKAATRRTGGSASGSRLPANAKQPAAAPRRVSRRTSSAGSASSTGSRSTSASSGRSRTQSERPAAERPTSDRTAPADRPRAASPAAASSPAPSRPRPRIYPAAAHPYSMEEQNSRGERGRSTGRSAPPPAPATPRPATNTTPALRRPATQAAPPATPRPAAPATRPPSAPRPSVPMRPPSAPARREPLAGRLHGWNDRLQSWWRSGVRPTAASTPAARPAGRPLHWPSLKRRPPAPEPAAPAAPAAPTSVRLVGAEEHRCPFCLELVQPDDPRGIVECSICHTQHHADCWEITGACQVPHYHG